MSSLDNGPYRHSIVNSIKSDSEYHAHIITCSCMSRYCFSRPLEKEPIFRETFSRRTPHPVIVTISNNVIVVG